MQEVQIIDGQKYKVEICVINGFTMRGLAPILSQEEEQKRAAQIKTCFIHIAENRRQNKKA